jgi:hypothetical protein
MGMDTGYLIDPSLQRVSLIELETPVVATIERLIGDTYGIDHAIISDVDDMIWVAGGSLLAQKPVYAFRLPTQRDPFAGKAIIIGGDDQHKPIIPIDVVKQDIEWLGLIIPTVTVINEETELFGRKAIRHRAVVTYERPKK